MRLLIKKYLPAVFLCLAVLLVGFSGYRMITSLSFNSQLDEVNKKIYGEHFASQTQCLEYRDKVPLDEMDLKVLYDNVSINWVYPSDNSNKNGYNTYTLEDDLKYYKRDGEKKKLAMTIPKGTEIIVGNEDHLSVLGYGCSLFPDYEDRWRYGRVFKTAEEYSGSAITEDYSEEHFYVKTRDIKNILSDFLRKSQYLAGEVPVTNERIEKSTDVVLYSCDTALLNSGIYDSGFQKKKVLDAITVLSLLFSFLFMISFYFSLKWKNK